MVGTGLFAPVALTAYLVNSAMPWVVGLLACMAVPRVRALTMSIYLLLSAAALGIWCAVLLTRSDGADPFRNLPDRLAAQQLRSVAIVTGLVALAIGAGALDRLFDRRS